MYQISLCFVNVNSSGSRKLPNKTESFLLRDMVDSNLLEPITSDPLARPEHVYLEPDFDLLGERALGEDCLHLQQHGGVNNHVKDF